MAHQVVPYEDFVEQRRRAMLHGKYLPIHQQLVPLTNTGNSCYVTAVVNFLFSSSYMSELFYNQSSGHPLLTALREMAAKDPTKDPTKEKPINAWDLRRAVVQQVPRAKQFVKKHQEDAAEFLDILLQAIEEVIENPTEKNVFKSKFTIGI